MISYYLSILISTFCLFLCPNRIVVNDYKDFQGTKQYAKYVIKKSIDLQGRQIILSNGSELKFAGGAIHNGCIVFNNSKISGMNITFSDVELQGKVKNDQLYARWFKSRSSDDDYLANAIKLACESNSSFVFDGRQYVFHSPIFIYGKCDLLGSKGTTISSYGNRHKIFILAGNTGVGGKAITWEGSIKNIRFVAQSGVYNYYLGLMNVRNCEVSDCSFDMSNKKVDCYNKIIASVNNAGFSNPSKGKGIAILRNTFRVQEEDEDRNNCECIGIESRTNVIIDGNIIYNTRDDLGIHNSNNVVIRNNIIYAYDGRIFVSNSTNVKVENNSISYIFKSTSGMGVFVGLESGYDQISEHITIVGNTIDYSNASDCPCYGIRVRGANYVDILNNVIRGNPTARIAIEIVEAKESQKDGLMNMGKLVPQYVRVEGNDTNGLWFAGYSQYKINSLEVVRNTIRETVTITNPDIIFKDNVLDEHTYSHPAPTKNLNIYKKL